MTFDLGKEGEGIGVVRGGIDFLENGGFLVEGDLYARHDTRFDLEALCTVTDGRDDEGAFFAEIGLEHKRAFLIRGSTDGRGLVVDAGVRDGFACFCTGDIADDDGFGG